MFESLDSLSLAFTTDEAEFQGLEAMVNKLSKTQQLHTLHITIWVESYVQEVFQALNDADLPMFTSVKNLTITTHGINSGVEEMQRFVAKFSGLVNLTTCPEHGFNALAGLDRSIDTLHIFTPQAQEDCDIVTAYLNQYPPVEL